MNKIRRIDEKEAINSQNTIEIFQRKSDNAIGFLDKNRKFVDLSFITNGSIHLENPDNGFIISNQDLKFGNLIVPNARIQKIDENSGYTFTNSVQSINNVLEAIVSAININNGNGFSVSVKSNELIIKQLTGNTTTAEFKIKDGNLIIRTADLIAGNVINGQPLVIDDPSTGTIKFEKKQWDTLNRPSSPYLGQTGFNTSLGFKEYWNGTSWIED